MGAAKDEMDNKSKDFVFSAAATARLGADATARLGADATARLGADPASFCTLISFFQLAVEGFTVLHNVLVQITFSQNVSRIFFHLNKNNRMPTTVAMTMPVKD